MSAGRQGACTSRVIAAILSGVAAAAVAITVPHTLAVRRAQPPPVAPGLAALSDQQLADLLPARNAFPADWTPNHNYDSPDRFGYGRYHNIGVSDGYQPLECHEVAYGIRTGSYPAATVDEHDPADRSTSRIPSSDILMQVGREFRPDVFDDMRALVARCAHFHARFPDFDFTTRIVEDTRPADAPQRFRYTVTVTSGRNPVYPITSRDYAYARFDHLIVSANATVGHQQMLDHFFAATVQRLATAHAPH
jgi:hypothetical protein